jgi:hypothetical protein
VESIVNPTVEIPSVLDDLIDDTPEKSGKINPKKSTCKKQLEEQDEDVLPKR